VIARESGLQLLREAAGDGLAAVILLRAHASLGAVVAACVALHDAGGGIGWFESGGWLLVADQ
jgi:hypothetical protein